MADNNATKTGGDGAMTQASDQRAQKLQQALDAARADFQREAPPAAKSPATPAPAAPVAKAPAAKPVPVPTPHKPSGNVAHNIPIVSTRSGLKPTGARAGEPGQTNETKVLRSVDPAKPALDFHSEPVVGWLVVVGGPGLGAYRPIYIGNNAIGRDKSQRIPIDFGDDAISKEEQAFIRYDAEDRQFLFVPNLAKTNVVSIDDVKPTSAVRLKSLDIIAMGRTKLVFVPFCGDGFDWGDVEA